MKKKLTPLILLFIILSVYANAQKIDSTLAQYADDYPQEKIHLHFDKGIYIKGDMIWFKAYLLTGLDLSDNSKNFYVDWFDDKGALLTHTVSPIFESSARGQFEVPANYTGKFLHVKAYTQWMLNFDTAFLYNKDIRIDQTVAAPSSTASAKPETTKKSAKQQANLPVPEAAKPKTPTATIHFFPEGGELLNDVTTRVAFLIENEFGLPVSAAGALKNNKGELIDSFITEHDGMGSFSIQPDSTQPYSATWLDEYGIAHTTPLPLAKTVGATLEVQPAKAKAMFFVNRSKEATPNLKTMFVIATMHQHEVYKSKINLSERLAAIGEIPTKDLPTGVLQITLFDADYAPLAERVTFVNNYQFLFTPQVRVTKAGLDKRAKNTIEIQVDDSVVSNMSVAVTDAGLLTDAGTNIASDLLLSGDIKGNINNPAYYFSSKADSVTHHLDLVMLTHGWRKFNWKDVASGTLPKITHPRETEFMELKGTIYGNMNKSAMLNQKIILLMQGKDSVKQSLFLDVDRAGNFGRKGVLFYDTIYVFYQLMGDKRLTDRVEIGFQTGLIQPPSMKYSSITTSPFLWAYNSKDSSLLERSRMFYNEKEKVKRQLAANELAEVTVRTKVKRAVDVLDEKYTSGLFAGGDSKQFDLTTDPFAVAAQDVFSYLQGRVAGLQINNSGADVTLSWRGSTPELYLDETKVEVDQLRNTPMTDVAYIKVFPPPFFGATGGGAGGAIAIYTRKGVDVKPTPGVGLNFKRLAGYTPYKEFYNPDYATSTPTYTEDARTTLYWNPFVLTYGKNHTVQLEFYNNDISKKLRLVIEGINRDGKIARVEKLIE
ncbi:hypothetical protein [Parasediminibacterium sp. JCM 36343]|uniref:hypothetical protein n=1 Tax=Parasediminibacterium sp. JCM 36343 TaxID=3374279 RepID=UPI00397DF49B